MLSDPPPTAADEKGARGYVRGWAILRAKRTRILEKDLDKKKLEAGVRRSVQRRGRALVLFLGNERDFIYASPKAKLPFLRCVTVVNRPNAVVRHFALFDVSSVDRPFVQRPEGNK